MSQPATPGLLKDGAISSEELQHTRDKVTEVRASLTAAREQLNETTAQIDRTTSRRRRGSRRNGRRIGESRWKSPPTSISSVTRALSRADRRSTRWRRAESTSVSVVNTDRYVVRPAW